MYWLALHKITGMSNHRLGLLLEHYSWDACLAWQERRNWQGVPRLGKEAARTLAAASNQVNPEAVYEEFLASGAKKVTLRDEDYPSLLKEIYEPPVLLLYHGSLPRQGSICLAVIGSRRASGYGRQVAALLSRDLARQGLWIVSGLARGIDALCHTAALEVGGKTGAVIGCGLDCYYPRENTRLQKELEEKGFVISELPLGTHPSARNFPQRNRIISGLSRGVVVIEAGDKSGTLLTVDYGLEQGRDIFAVPGPITSPLSKGTNRLLQQGCRLVTSAQDIWEEYISEPRLFPLEEEKPRVQVNPQERQILSQLVLPVHFDELCQQFQLSPSQLASMLTMWEIKGKIKQLPGNYYQAKLQRI